MSTGLMPDFQAALGGARTIFEKTGIDPANAMVTGSYVLFKLIEQIHGECRWIPGNIDIFVGPKICGHVRGRDLAKRLVGVASDVFPGGRAKFSGNGRVRVFIHGVKVNIVPRPLSCASPDMDPEVTHAAVFDMSICKVWFPLNSPSNTTIQCADGVIDDIKNGRMRVSSDLRPEIFYDPVFYSMKTALCDMGHSRPDDLRTISDDTAKLRIAHPDGMSYHEHCLVAERIMKYHGRGFTPVGDDPGLYRCNVGW